MEYWKTWMDEPRQEKGPNYPAKRVAKQHIINAGKVSPALALLLMLVTKATPLSTLRPRDCSETFRWWWDTIKSCCGDNLSGLEEIVQREEIVRFVLHE